MPAGRHQRAAKGGQAAYPRALRVNEVLRQILAEEIERLSDADERLRLVTVTSVSTSPDLRQATVYVGTLPEAVATALEERRVGLQRQIGTQVRMKRTPRLAFAADPGVAAGARVEELLRRLGDPPADGDADPGAETRPAL
jgi:ribosome-binding factor A